MKTCYDYVILSIQLVGVVVLIWYTIETFRMRKQNDKEAKETEKRHLTSVRPVISIGSVGDTAKTPVSVIGETRFVIHNFGNGAAIDVETLCFTQGSELCSVFNTGFPYIGAKEGRLVENLTTASVEDAAIGIGRKYGDKARQYFLSIRPLDANSRFQTRHLVVFCRDIYGNIYAMQRDLLLNGSGHGTYANGEESRRMIDGETCDAQPVVPAGQPLQLRTPQHDEARRAYDSIASAQAALLDKSIISISGASFSITIGFIDKLIPLASAKVTWMLWFALLILACSIIVTTMSFWAGEKTARLKSKVCGPACENEDAALRGSANAWDKRLSLLNGGRLVFFILGIVLLAGFIFYNGITGVTSKAKEPAQTAAQQITAPNIESARNATGTGQQKE